MNTSQTHYRRVDYLFEISEVIVVLLGGSKPVALELSVFTLAKKDFSYLGGGGKDVTLVTS